MKQSIGSCSIWTQFVWHEPSVQSNWNLLLVYIWATTPRKGFGLKIHAGRYVIILGIRLKQIPGSLLFISSCCRISSIFIKLLFEYMILLIRVCCFWAFFSCSFLFFDAIFFARLFLLFFANLDSSFPKADFWTSYSLPSKVSTRFPVFSFRPGVLSLKGDAVFESSMIFFSKCVLILFPCFPMDYGQNTSSWKSLLSTRCQLFWFASFGCSESLSSSAAGLSMKTAIQNVFLCIDKGGISYPRWSHQLWHT